MISFKSEQSLIEELVSGLVHPQCPTSWNLVLPPVFNEHQLGSQITAALKEIRPAILVASISSDSVKDAWDYVSELHRQWSETVRLPPLDRSTGATIALQRLLGSVAVGRPVVQILLRFHKVLDSLDQWVLGALRTAEQARCLRTLTISPFDYSELKRRWERVGKILILSDYGDTHGYRTVEVLPAEDILAACQAADIPRYVVNFALSLTGGYPEPFNAIVEEWQRMRQPRLTPGVQMCLRSQAERRVRRLVEMLDPLGESRYREHLINIHYGIDVEEARQVLAIHPWASTLLDEEGGLRAEILGNVAVDWMVRDAVEKGDGALGVAATVDLAQSMYQQKQYTTTLQLLERRDISACPDYVCILLQHARIMAALYGSHNDEPGVDTDWKRVRSAISDARTVLDRARERIRAWERIEERYQDIEAVADAIVKAMVGGQHRVVDTLTQTHLKGSPSAQKTALLLLLLKLEAGRSIAGHASACQAVLALPEQIFRTWAVWNLGLDYSKAPVGHDDVWDDVEAEWPHGSLTRPVPGEQFPSFVSFAFFALTLALRRSEQVIKPEPDLRTLNQALSALDVRRDFAHAVALTTAKWRERFFALIDRWFDALLTPTPGQGTMHSRAELLSLVEPLPVVGKDYAVEWL